MIQWVGCQKWDTDFPELPLPACARQLEFPEHMLTAALPYGVLPMLICFAALFGKIAASPVFPVDRRFVPLGILLGLLLIPVHEVLHAVCFPKGATVYVGLAPEKLAAFAVCFFPVSRRRFCVMSLLPVVLGLTPLALFCFFPADWGAAAALCWPAAMIGLISPCPDYMSVLRVMRQAPAGAFIQGSNSGWYWYFPNERKQKHEP